MITEIGSVARHLLGREQLAGEAAEDEGDRQLRAEHHLRGDQHPEVAAGAGVGRDGRSAVAIGAASSRRASGSKRAFAR